MITQATAPLDTALLHVVCAHLRGEPVVLAVETDWCALLHKAFRQKVALLAWQALARDPSAVPPELWARFDAWAGDRRRKNGFFALHLRRILALLSTAEIPVLVVKGLALAVGAYGRIDGRTFDDIDLLIPPTHIDAALALMRAEGFIPALPDADTPAEHEYHHSLTHPRWHISLELHWRAGWRHFNHRHFPIDIDALFAEARALPLLNGVMHTPSVEHTLVLLAIDTLKERRAPLGRLCDALLLARDPALDWDALWAFARAAGAQQETAALLGAAAAIDRLPIPALPKSRLIAHMRAKLLHDSLNEQEVPMLRQLIFYWAMRRTRAERLAFMRALLLDPANRSFFALTILRDGLGAFNRRLRLHRMPGGKQMYRLIKQRVSDRLARARVDFYRK